MMKKTIAAILSLVLVLSLVGCTVAEGQPDTSEPVSSEATEVIEVIEPLPDYTFEEIVQNEGTYFNVSGAEFGIRSEVANYYGDITVGNRSYIDGMSGDIDVDEYALFVVDGGEQTTIVITFNRDGYYRAYSESGTKSGSAVKFTMSEQALAEMNTCSQGFSKTITISNLSHVRASWGNTNSVLSNVAGEMLAVVITKEDAIRYVQDGTLPTCLKGLKVSGLDEIFKAPDTTNEDQKPEDIEEVADVVIDDSWKDAYAAYLRSDDRFDEWKEELGGFRLYDMDSNGIPELFVEYLDRGGKAYADVFTYDKEMVNVGNLYGGAGVGIEVSENPMYQGVFHQTYGYGTEHLSVYYSELKGNKLETTHVSISEYVENKSDFVVSEMHNQKLYDEWENLKHTASYEGTEANIQKYIYGIEATGNVALLKGL